MARVLDIAVDQGVGVLTIDSPPVNALGFDVRVALDDGFRRLHADDAVRSIVLICGGRTFFAGADIAEFGLPVRGPDLYAVWDRIELGSKPVIAAMHGTALGGGLEMALLCHHRISVPSAKFGLPEVNLGILPGGGGTQRLPRIVGVEMALDMIAFGKPIDARQALELGLIDALANEQELRADAIAFARQVAGTPNALRRVRDLDDKLAAARGKPEIFTDFRRRHARAFRGFKAPEHIVRALEASVKLPFEEGMKVERALVTELIASPESAAQRHAFFAERQTAKIPDLPANTPTRPVKAAAVIGAGTMGSGIATCLLNADIPVTLIDANNDALERGRATIHSKLEHARQKGRMTAQDAARRLSLLTTSLDIAAAANADLVVEAVFESMALKLDVFAQLDRCTKPAAILATNTSFLDIDRIAAATSRPAQVLGLHFFAPANIMRLLEVVRGARTAADVLASALLLAKRLGKVPVVAGVCHGFIANRAMSVRSAEANIMILEGTPFELIDQALHNYGFAMGPFQLLDLVGLDVIGRDSNERTPAKGLVARGRLGQKQNGGFYDYDSERRATPSPVAREVIAELARERGIAADPTLDEAAIVWRLLAGVVNEGARILEEKIAYRASDIDVACLLGFNWPVYTGGPMHWANHVGLTKVQDSLLSLQARYGERFQPSALLRRLVSQGEHFT